MVAVVAALIAILASDSSAPPVVHAEPDEVDTDGLSRPIVRRVILRHIAAVRVCYERVTDTAIGEIVVRFVIAGDGRVTSSTVARSTVTDPAVGPCIAAALSQMVFPTTRSGRPVVITYPFRLRH